MKPLKNSSDTIMILTSIIKYSQNLDLLMWMTAAMDSVLNASKSWNVGFMKN